MFENEEWREIEALSHYLVSTHGRIKHANAVAPREVSINGQGAVVLILYGNNGTRYLRQVNHLVLRAFAPRPETPSHNSAWHDDGNLANCRADNLRWERRGRVLEWNEMHRAGQPKIKTPRVKNNRTGHIYESAYDCAIAERCLESEIVYRVERLGSNVFDNKAPYRYLEK